MANTYQKNLTKGRESSISTTPIEDGKLRFTTDTGRCYMDFDENGTAKRVLISDVIFDKNETQIKAITNPLQKLYISSNTGKIFYPVNGTLKEIDRLSLTSVADNRNYMLWFSTTGQDTPRYSTQLYYNPSTDTMTLGNVVAKTVKVNHMLITETHTDENDHIVDFQIVV